MLITYSYGQEKVLPEVQLDAQEVHLTDQEVLLIRTQATPSEVHLTASKKFYGETCVRHELKRVRGPDPSCRL